MLQPVKNIDEYIKIKQNLRERFEADRTGEQHLFIEQTKLLEPVIKSLISTQEHTVSAIRAQQPLVRPALTMPEAPRALEAATEEEPIKIDLDSGLDEIDVRNLQDMGFQ